MRFHHPDRLGTRLVTDAGGTVVSEQLSMPFGTMLPFTQSYGGENSYQHPTLANPSKKRFTSYDRSDAIGLDYAVNRFYSSQQGRFTQVDPIGMSASSLSNPQTLNLYSYCGNDPINHVDPDGLFFGKLFGWIGKAFKWIAIAAIVAVAVLTIAPGAWAGTLLAKIGIWSIKHPILSSLIGLKTPQWAIINLAKSAGGAAAAGFWAMAGVGAVSGFVAQAGQGRKFGSAITKENEPILTEALNLSFKALKKPKCKKLIAGKVGKDPAKLLNTLEESSQLRQGNLMKLISRQAGGVTDGYGADAFITFDDYFFFKDPRMGMRTELLSTSVEVARAVTVLHELSHATAKFTHPGFKRDFNETIIGGEELDKKIYKTCFEGSEKK